MQLLKGLRLLEEAHNQKNWEKVRVAYEYICGEQLSYIEEDEPVGEKYQTISDTKLTPKQKSKVKKAVAKRGRPSNKTLEEHLKKENYTKGPIKSETAPTTPKTSQVRFTGNTFVDDGKLAVEDKKIDKLLSKGWKKPEKRDSHNYKEVPCDTKGCKEVVNVDPSLYINETSYYCNGCLSKKR